MRRYLRKVWGEFILPCGGLAIMIGLGGLIGTVVFSFCIIPAIIVTSLSGTGETSPTSVQLTDERCSGEAYQTITGYSQDLLKWLMEIDGWVVQSEVVGESQTLRALYLYCVPEKVGMWPGVGSHGRW